MAVLSARFGILLLALVAAGRSAVAQTDASPSRLFLDRRWRPPGNQRCEVTRGEPFPPLEAVFDSAAVARAALAMGPGIFVVSILAFPIDSAVAVRDSVTLDSVTIVEATLSDSARSEMHRLLHRSLRPRARASLLLRIEVDSAVRFRTADIEECRPAEVDREQAVRALQNLRSHGYRGRARLRVVIDVDGVPRDVTVERSSGNPRLDQWLVVLVQSSTWYPGRINRVPIRVAVLFPLNIY